MEEAELTRAAEEVVGWDADVGWRVDEAFPEVEVAAWRSRVKAWVGGPVQEVSGSSVAVEVCSSDVSAEESVALRGGAVGRSELNSKSTRWEEPKIQ